ncbi:FtsX-like permease family protein [Clostridium estertheticum]|uniref:Permease n=1 Tax=Clostridium estertheticum subsp. estertheticum TaxID=1552 RepID=A0A1J0GFP5_9CLOT|nr:ABC transporter permease [Clostridium estertheticum]APC40111.1 permease [Clostridium estertheticum subsp. estertheticum]MBU3170328.1 ABC transporter permease [Clostridium estertheticum]MBZ9618108.1 ABC transporter permease [Clostridium estertheticum subsp. laramiense]WAG73761.1 ABC transporter permease [Clostridium estertheticum]
MTLISMAVNNIKKNFKNYWTFFLSSSFSVFVLYLFMSIVYNEDVKAKLGNMKSIMIVFIIAAYMIAAFSAFFIWYSNSFLIKSRKKEFATYMLLGMSKKQVVKLNIIENLITIAFAFCSGIILGLIFNKFFIMLLYVMIRVTGDVSFQISLEALKFCSIVFGAMFIIISIHGSKLIYRDNLIDLFNSSKKAEKGLKVSHLTMIISILSIVFLGYGYYIAIRNLAANILLTPIVVLLVVIGTILFFTSFTSLIIYISKKNEKSLFKGTKLIYISQLYYRYKGNVGTLSVIAITTSVALCASIFCFGFFNKVEENSRNMRPFSIEYANGTNNTDKIFENTIKNHKEISVVYKDNMEFFKVKTKDFLLGNHEFLVLNESKFNEINSHEKSDMKINLKNDMDCNFVQVANFVSDKSVIGKEVKLSGGGSDYNLKITDTYKKSFMAIDDSKPTLIVKDSVYSQIKSTISKENTYKVTGYMLNNDFLSENFIKDLKIVIPQETKLLTFYENFMDGIKMMGILAFIGLFIGLIFVTATGGIIYFKMCMEASEDKNKFIILKNIGASKAEITKAISKELMILFGIPFVVATINTFAASIPIGKMVAVNITKEFIIIILVYAVLYSIYYLITLKAYIKIVSN